MASAAPLLVLSNFILLLVLQQVDAQGFYGVGNTPLRCLASMYTTCTYVTDPPDKKGKRSVPFSNRSSNNSEALGALSLSAAEHRRVKRSFVTCESDGNCSEDDRPNGQTCCSVCKSCVYKNCCHCSFTKPDTYCPIPGWRSKDYTGDKNKPKPPPEKKTQFVNCGDNGVCTKKDKPSPVTCCKNCKSCMYESCCHCAFTDSTKYCPIPGTRSKDYTGDKHKRAGLGQCGDPEQFSIQIYQYAAWLLTITIMTQQGFTYSPYRLHDWSYVDPGTNRPNDGQVVVRSMDRNGDDRVEYMYRIVRPQDLQSPPNGFTQTQRTQWFASLGGRTTDEAGHILAKSVGGPNTRGNFFPQHATVNRNLDGRWLMDSWLDTETAMRNFLRQGIPGSYIIFRAALIYGDTNTGRPEEIAWAVVFVDPNRANPTTHTMGGRLRNEAARDNGPQGTCKKPR